MGEHQRKIEEFNKFFTENYNLLTGFSKSINPKADYESLTHNSYIKCINAIEKRGYDGKDYLNFTRVVVMNTYKSNYRDKKNIISFEDADFEIEIESCLHLKDYQDQQEEEIRRKEEFLNTIIYEFVDRYYSRKENFIFKTYYLLQRKKINYKQLSEVTGYSITSVSNVIKKIKKDLKENLLRYINTGER